MNTYIVEVPLKGHVEPEYVCCTSVEPDTENEAKRRALEGIRAGGEAPGSPMRVLVIRECDNDRIREESVRQFVGPARSGLVPTMLGFLPRQPVPEQLAVLL